MQLDCDIHSPLSVLLLVFTSLIRTPVNSNHFPFPMGHRINGVQLYIHELDQNSKNDDV